MILRRILVVFFSLTRASNATFPSDLAEDVSKLSINDTNPIEVAGFSEPLLTLEDIIRQGDELRASTLNDDIETVVSKLDQQLLNLLELGVAPFDVTPMINCFPFAAEELVLAAQKVQAYILLKLLQMIYIWRDDAQFHWFQALSYDSPWYDESMWNTHLMDWRSNLDAVYAWDNVALAMVIQKEISPKSTLDIFDKNFVLYCARNDAIKIFESMRMDPIVLEKHLGIMGGCGSIKLLRLYQTSFKVKHLHLERFSFSGRLPTSVDDFAFLMTHGYDCFPMDQFIKRFCREGRLDLLQYLYGLDPKLLPYTDDLVVAAEKGWLDILQWGRNLIQGWQISKIIAIKLAVNDHFKALDWLVNESNITIDDEMIKEIIVAGKLKALQWIYEKQPFGFNAEWVTLAAENLHLPVLKWLCGTFKLTPTTYALRNATVEMLDWIKATYSTLITAELVKHGAGNLELLQWIHRNAPISIFNGKKLILSLAIQNKNIMQWLYTEFKICPTNMTWAYKAGDLEAIQWALENCQILPTVDNTACAMDSGHVHVIKWFHENYPEHSKVIEAIKVFKYYGSRDMVDYIVLNFDPKRVITFNSIWDSAEWDIRLDHLKWIRERKHVFGESLLSQEIDKVVSAGQLQPFLCFLKTFPGTQPSEFIWNLVAKSGHHEVYKWHLENCSLREIISGFESDIQAAFVNGHLEIVKLILHKYPKHYEDISTLEITRSNYHIKRWLDTNFEPVKSFSLKWLFADQ